MRLIIDRLALGGTKPVDEQHLLQDIRRLDEAAMSTIYHTYYDALYRYIYHHTGHMQTAEDLTAETFSRLVEQLRQGKGPQEHLRAWLYRVARNLVIDEARHGRSRRQQPLDERIAANGVDVAAQAERAILRQQSAEALKALTPKQRDVIILHYMEGLSNAEVAEIMNLPLTAVKALQQRGLAAMRRHLLRSGAVTEGTL